MSFRGFFAGLNFICEHLSPRTWTGFLILMMEIFLLNIGLPFNPLKCVPTV